MEGPGYRKRVVCQPRGFSSRRRLACALVVVILAAAAGCSVRVGSADSASAWAERADRALGAATSSLGTTRVVLENQLSENLTRSFVVVAVRDTITSLDGETATFLTAQPPSGAEQAHRRVTAALLHSLEVLAAASNAATAGDGAARRRALAAVERQRRSVAELQDSVQRMLR